MVKFNRFALGFLILAAFLVVLSVFVFAASLPNSSQPYAPYTLQPVTLDAQRQAIFTQREGTDAEVVFLLKSLKNLGVEGSITSKDVTLKVPNDVLLFHFYYKEGKRIYLCSYSYDVSSGVGLRDDPKTCLLDSAKNYKGEPWHDELQFKANTGSPVTVRLGNYSQDVISDVYLNGADTSIIFELADASPDAKYYCKPDNSVCFFLSGDEQSDMSIDVRSIWLAVKTNSIPAQNTISCTTISQCLARIDRNLIDNLIGKLSASGPASIAGQQIPPPPDGSAQPPTSPNQPNVPDQKPAAQQNGVSFKAEAFYDDFDMAGDFGKFGANGFDDMFVKLFIESQAPLTIKEILLKSDSAVWSTRYPESYPLVVSKSHALPSPYNSNYVENLDLRLLAGPSQIYLYGDSSLLSNFTQFKGGYLLVVDGNNELFEIDVPAKTLTFYTGMPVSGAADTSQSKPNPPDNQIIGPPAPDAIVTGNLVTLLGKDYVGKNGDWKPDGIEDEQYEIQVNLVSPKSIKAIEIYEGSGSAPEERDLVSTQAEFAYPLVAFSGTTQINNSPSDDFGFPLPAGISGLTLFGSGMGKGFYEYDSIKKTYSASRTEALIQVFFTDGTYANGNIPAKVFTLTKEQYDSLAGGTPAAGTSSKPPSSSGINLVESSNGAFILYPYKGATRTSLDTGGWGGIGVSGRQVNPGNGIYFYGETQGNQFYFARLEVLPGSFVQPMIMKYDDESGVEGRWENDGSPVKNTAWFSESDFTYGPIISKSEQESGGINFHDYRASPDGTLLYTKTVKDFEAQLLGSQNTALDLSELKRLLYNDALAKNPGLKVSAEVENTITSLPKNTNDSLSPHPGTMGSRYIRHITKTYTKSSVQSLARRIISDRAYVADVSKIISFGPSIGIGIVDITSNGTVSVTWAVSEVPVTGANDASSQSTTKAPQNQPAAFPAGWKLSELQLALYKDLIAKSPGLKADPEIEKLTSTMPHTSDFIVGYKSGASGTYFIYYITKSYAKDSPENLMKKISADPFYAYILDTLKKSPTIKSVGINVDLIAPTGDIVVKWAFSDKPGVAGLPSAGAQVPAATEVQKLDYTWTSGGAYVPVLENAEGTATPATDQSGTNHPRTFLPAEPALPDAQAPMTISAEPLHYVWTSGGAYVPELERPESTNTPAPPAISRTRDFNPAEFFLNSSQTASTNTPPAELSSPQVTNTLPSVSAVEPTSLKSDVVSGIFEIGAINSRNPSLPKLWRDSQLEKIATEVAGYAASAPSNKPLDIETVINNTSIRQKILDYGTQPTILGFIPYGSKIPALNEYGFDYIVVPQSEIIQFAEPYIGKFGSMPFPRPELSKYLQGEKYNLIGAGATRGTNNTWHIIIFYGEGKK
ncbi:MAG TPA: hypothetical protein VJH23_05640 [archaeon]|nr:hypothetical protein [archaeon]